MRKLGILLGGALRLPHARCTASRSAAGSQQPAPGARIRGAGGSADQFEIQSGQLALQASQNPAVRNFANMLIADHTQSNSS